MKKSLVIVFILLTNFICAQTASIKGRVISETNQPILGANVILSGTNFGDAANVQGFFDIKNVPFGNYIVEVSSIGYEKKKINFVLNQVSKSITVILKESVIETQQVVVSAGKYEQKKEDLTVSTTVILPEAISLKNHITFDDLLRTVPGIQMNLEQVSIRGSSGYSKGVGARVLVALNGLPLYAGDNGDVVWELVPLSDIERVEIIKGPASSLYGSSAIGGVINIITKQSVKNSFTNIKTYVGAFDNPSYDLWKWNDKPRIFFGAEVTHSNSYENLGYTISLKKFDNMSYRQNDYSKRYLGYLKLHYSLSDHNSITFFSNYLNMNRGNFLYWKNSRNALVPKDEDNGNIVKSDRIFSGLNYHHAFNSTTNIDFKTSYYRTKFDGIGLELTTSTADLIRGEVIANHKYSENLFVTSGAEASYSNVSSNIFSNTNFYGGAFYSQFEFKGIKNLVAVVGLRYDYIKLDTISGKNAITPRAGLNYKLTPDIIIRTSLGTGFRAPTPAEVFTTAGVGGGISIKQNPNLTSESSISFEAGVLYQYSKDVSFDLAFFQTDYNDFIEANLLNDGSIQFVNLSKARIQGVEAIYDHNIIPGELKLSMGYNYLWARDIEKNKAMKYRPRNSVNLQARYTPGQFDLGVDFRYSSKVEEIDLELTRPPFALVSDGEKRVPVYVADLMFGYNFFVSGLPAKLYFNIKNAFNYNYVEFIGNLAPIRNYSLSAEIFF